MLRYIAEIRNHKKGLNQRKFITVGDARLFDDYNMVVNIQNWEAIDEILQTGNNPQIHLFLKDQYKDLIGKEDY